ncbi:hypothetical protein CC78DRAFT_611419 [Lojkania enalia]|uniref:Uncharacterized protein n=1 Tax=Lojkania enalia TaxID=147567 RepID=A0A9P4NC83_9PLEO|nr:hypothetical protein CC78DRAFT_611419 [Didymosphaeria enalia]
MTWSAMGLWILAIFYSINTLAGYFFFRETYVSIFPPRRKAAYEYSPSSTPKYRPDGEDTPPLIKIIHSPQHPLCLCPAHCSQNIHISSPHLRPHIPALHKHTGHLRPPYRIFTELAGLLYLDLWTSFLFAVLFLAPRIDDIYKAPTFRNGRRTLPEYRLPLATVSNTFFYGVEQVTTLNCTQNYFIDAFEAIAPSATSCRWWPPGCSARWAWISVRLFGSRLSSLIHLRPSPSPNPTVEISLSNKFDRLQNVEWKTFVYTLLLYFSG